MTLKMTSAQVVETSVIVNNDSSFQNYTHPTITLNRLASVVFVKLIIYSLWSTSTLVYSLKYLPSPQNVNFAKGLLNFGTIFTVKKETLPL